MKTKQKSIGYPITKKVLVMSLILITFLGIAGSVQAQEEEIVAITIAPSTLTLDDSGEWVTVHTDIAYSDYDPEVDLQLNGVDVACTKADNCGNLVAKFAQTDIMEIVEEGEVTLVLTGGTLDSVHFTGEDTIRVITSGK